MSRDELILSFEDVVDNLVKKYNDGKLDEDLHSEGMIKVIKAVDKCLSEGVTERENMIGRVIVWVSNALLDVVRKPKILLLDDFDLDEDSYNLDYETLIIDVKSSLEPIDKTIFCKLMCGEDKQEICEDLGLSMCAIYKHLEKIKNIILKFKS